MSEEQSPPSPRTTFIYRNKHWIVGTVVLLVVVAGIFIFPQLFPYVLTVVLTLLVVAGIAMWSRKYLINYLGKHEQKDLKKKADYASQRAQIFILPLFATVGGFLGGVILFQQNQLLNAQNNKIDIQIEMEEANRRSSYVFILDDLLDKVDAELSEAEEHEHSRKISAPLVGRIKAVSQGFKPYRYLENGELIDSSLSPERGQLLLALTGCEMDSLTYNKIFLAVPFSKVDLKDANFENANLQYVDLTDSNCSRTDFSKANLSGCNFARANLSYAKFNGAILKGANFRQKIRTESQQEVIFSGCKFEGADLSGVDLLGTNLTGVVFSRAILSGANLREAILEKADFQYCNLEETNLTGAKGLTLEQLEQAEYLFGCQGIRVDWLSFLKQNHPEKFRKSEKR